MQKIVDLVTGTFFCAPWKGYFELCKPKVVALMLLTTIVGMLMATPSLPAATILLFAPIGIGLVACCAAVINHLIDQRIDTIMARTKRRPLVRRTITPQQAITFALILGCLGTIILLVFVNSLTTILTLVSLIAYAGIYTTYLKHATSQNIVIGGLAGATPPLLGWTAVTGYLNPESLLLVLIIFTWTPPHFWALAIYRYDDYLNAKIPMLPVQYGVPYTKLSILLYTILLIVVSLLPFAVGMSGWIYFIAAIVLGLRFLYWAIVLLRSNQAITAMYTFRYSITYLMLLFIFLLVDHYFLF